MPSSKRDRQKQNRQIARSDAAAALRRRRLTRLGAGTVIVIVLVLAAVIFGPQNGAEEPSGSKGRLGGASPSASSSLAPGNTAALPPGCRQEDRPQGGPTRLPTPRSGAYAQPGKVYEAVIHTNCGDIKVTLNAKQAPETVNSFVYLAEKGFYDGLLWHRIVRNFVIQAGDPNGKNGVPPDGPGYTIEDEFPDRSNVYTFGTIAMANTGRPDSGGSQFFIVVHEGNKAKARFTQPAGLQPSYTVFGKVDRSSFPVLERIAKVPVEGGTDPVTQSEPVAPVFIESIDVAGD